MTALAPRNAQIVIGIVCAILIGVVLAGHYKTPKNEFVIGSRSYQLERAVTDEERTTGLSGRTELAEEKGMLFIFSSSARHCFWMKDTNFSLDMIWLNQEKRVIHLYENIAPETYPQSFCSNDTGRFGIELPAGSIQASGIRFGDYINL